MHEDDGRGRCPDGGPELNTSPIGSFAIHAALVRPLHGRRYLSLGAKVKIIYSFLVVRRVMQGRDGREAATAATATALRLPEHDTCMVESEIVVASGSHDGTSPLPMLIRNDQ